MLAAREAAARVPGDAAGVGGDDGELVELVLELVLELHHEQVQQTVISATE